MKRPIARRLIAASVPAAVAVVGLLAEAVRRGEPLVSPFVRRMAHVLERFAA